MDKLTTEILEKFVNDIKTDGMCDITDYQVALALRQLLAYEQAANEVACWGVTGQRGQIYPLSPQTARMDSFPLYRAPVLPKQPELVERVTAEQMQAVCMEATRHIGKYAAMAKEVNKLLGRKPAPAQPVIPDEITSASAPEVFEIAAEAERLGIRGTYGSYAVGWNACRAEMLKAQQNEPQNIPENITTAHSAYISFDALMAAVSEVTGVKREFDATPEKGYQAVPFMNFNSLSRIVEMFRSAQPDQLSMTSERELFKAWNNDIDCPIAGLEPSNAAWRAWISRAAIAPAVQESKA